MRYFVTIWMIAFACLFSSCSQKAKVALIQLCVENLSNPMGIDVQVPRFSWIIQCEASEVSQTGYHILVASSLENLQDGVGDLWDSGEVPSDSSIYISYKEKKRNILFFIKIS